MDSINMKYQTHTLQNGLRIIHLPTDSDVAHCGLFINAGSRDEMPHEKGIAHFVEHLMFKGTQKRKAFHILSRMDDSGGEINAYTSKEETCIHSSFLKNDYERSLELMSDIIFHSTFPGSEIKKEKEVILDEINSYKDTPSELIFDDFEEMIFSNQTLGSNILGDPKLLKKFTKEDIQQFVERNYQPERMVISSIGNISFQKLVKLATKYFGDFTSNSAFNEREPVQNYQPKSLTIQKNTNQIHSIIGNVSYGMHDSKRIPMALLENLIAGPGMNNRLNMALREKLGYVYHVESNYTAFSDIGLFSVYFGTEPAKREKSLEHIYKEFKKLRNQKLGKIQLSKAKKQLFGQIAISAENNASLMLSIGKNFLFTGKADTIEEVYKKIEEVTAEDIIQIANEVLYPDKLSILTYE
jgi:predicted Zn-dependent peptidase